MSFRQYISEGGMNREYAKPRSKPLVLDDAIKYVKRDCKQFMKKLVNMQVPYIYRGIKGMTHDFGIADPTKGATRMSANTNNYMTLLMDNLPSWKGYPLRSKSLICTPNKGMATSYKSWGGTPGEVYVVIPFDKASMGICPANDVWGSFYKSLHSDVDYFNRHLHDLIQLHGLSPSRAEQSWADFKENMNDVVDAYYQLLEDKHDDDPEIDEYEKTQHLNRFAAMGMRGMYPVLDSFFKKPKQGDIIKHFDKYLSPKYNNFRLNNLQKTDVGNEIWIGNAPCVLIRAETFDRFMDAIEL